MIEATIVNVGAFKELSGKMLTAAQSETLLRGISVSMLAVTRRRIHDQGKNANDSAIGTYSKSYLDWRKANGYKSDSSVKLFLTGQMQNDYKVVPLSKTEYGLGYNNSINANKAEWAEDRYGKIFALTDNELEQVRNIVKEYIAKIFK